MRLSISRKIFLGFVVVILAFGGAAGHGVWAVHRLGQELRLVALGYSSLRIALQVLLTLQTNLLNRLSAGPARQREVDADRRLRGVLLPRAQGILAELRRSAPERDAAFLEQMAARLAALDRLGSRPAEEEQAQRLLSELSTDLSNKVVEVAELSQDYERRALWMTVLLSIGATGFGVLVMLLVQATLRPLKTLAASARQVARGNYQERVRADSPDEVGALGREFNAMAAALMEREQRLRRSEQLAAVGKMAAQITHEVRNPLSSIGLNAELLADEVAGMGSEAQALARAIVKEVDRLTQITEQYLRLARIPAPRFEPEDLSALCADLLRFMAGELSARGVTVAAALQPGLPPVPVDENQLRQALLNLVRNAAEAMAGLPPERRRLTVRTGRSRREEGEAVVIEIQDRGPGIPPEHLPCIFEPFFTTKQGGTGLGLALAHEVVLRHGGSLRVRTMEEGGGTCFFIELPVNRPAMAPPGAAAPGARPGATPGADPAV